jgi:hypothetical protein
MKCAAIDEAEVRAKEATGRLEGNAKLARQIAQRATMIALAVCALIISLHSNTTAQVTLPFEVSNPKHLHWSMEEAGRIYNSACNLVARNLRPEKPPQLQPKFLLVLGARANQTVRSGDSSEIHLKKWDPARFAEAMVILSLREAVKNDDVVRLARETLYAAESTVTVNELRQEK